MDHNVSLVRTITVMIVQKILVMVVKMDII